MGKNSFWWFLKWSFGAREHCLKTPGDNWLDERVHKGWAHFLDRQVKRWESARAAGLREPMDILFMVPRGFGKSTIGCALDLWLHLRNPNLATIISSYDEAKSVEFLNVIKRYMQGDATYGLFRSLYGSWAPTFDEREWRRDFVTHTLRTNLAIRDHSFRVSSVAKGITGSRPDVFRLDDPIVKEKLTPDGNWIEKAKEHLDASRFAVKTNGLRIVYLTPYTENDVATKILMEDGVREFAREGMILPKDRFKEGGSWYVYYLRALNDNLEPVLPKIYPKERLDELESADPDDFASQMMCDPVSGSHMPLSREDIERCWVLEKNLPAHLDVSIHVDTAFKEASRKRRGDFNVIQTWGHEYGTGRVFFLGARRSQEWGPKEFVLHLVDILRDLQSQRRWPFVITDERTPGGKTGMLGEFLMGECRKAGIKFPNFLELTHTAKAKEMRIRQAVYGWKSGKVGLVRGANEVESLIYEMLRIGYSKHDDMADAASMVFHSEVYMPQVNRLNEPVADEKPRPLDELMWSQPGTWSENELRDVYDEGGFRRDEDEEALLGSGMWPNEERQ